VRYNGDEPWLGPAAAYDLIGRCPASRSGPTLSFRYLCQWPGASAGWRNEYERDHRTGSASDR